MIKKLFWSKYFTWFRKIVGLTEVTEKPDIPWDLVLKETDMMARAMGIEPAGETRKTYSSFSGVDVKFWVKPIGGEWIYLPETQGISYTYDGDVAGGVITFVVFDRDPIAGLPPSETYTILLEAANEFGHVAHAKFNEVKFAKTHWGINIEDIITDMKVEFTSKSHKPWTSQEDCPPPYTKEDVDRLRDKGELEKLIQMRLDSR